MPKFLTYGAYQPQNYTLDDYLRYLDVKERYDKQSPVLSLELKNQIFSSYRTRMLAAGPSETIFIDCVMSIAESVSLSMLRPLGQPISTFKAKSDTSPEFLQIVQSFQETLESMQTPTVEFGDPNELAPTFLSAQRLRKAWFSLCLTSFDYPLISKQSNWESTLQQRAVQNNISEDILHAHIANLKMILNPDYNEQCHQEFMEQGQVVMPIMPPRRKSALHFLIAVYQAPWFRHWLSQMLLFTLLMVTVAIIAAFFFKVGMLSTILCGFSKLAGNVVFGTATTSAVVTTIALTASLHAACFFKPKDQSGPDSGAEHRSTRKKAWP